MRIPGLELYHESYLGMAKQCVIFLSGRSDDTRQILQCSGVLADWLMIYLGAD